MAIKPKSYYSYYSQIALNEMYRVLMKGGLCYVNVLSKDDINFDEKEETNPG